MNKLAGIQVSRGGVNDASIQWRSRRHLDEQGTLIARYSDSIIRLETSPAFNTAGK